MLILASSSPRRQELLRSAGIEFVVRPPADVPEVQRAGESPADLTKRLARDKAHAIWSQLDEDGHSRDLVLGADTVVVIGEEILGKPRDRAEAACMLRQLSGSSHEVITGVCLMGVNRGGGAEFEDLAKQSTAVVFEPLSEAEIQAYVASGEPMDKAGAYAIQGIASRWISRVEGDYSNVVGLPVQLVYKMLRARGAV